MKNRVGKRMRMIQLLFSGVFLLLAACSLVFAGDDKAPKEGPASISDGSLTISGEKVPGKLLVLGSQIGASSIRGMGVSLNVLKATSPEKLKPGSPDHIFTVILTGKDGKPVKNEKVSLAISGEGKEQKVGLPFLNAYYQGGARLDRPGIYEIRVKINGKAKAESPPFKYEYVKASASAKETLPAGKSQKE